jgi:glycosyltransferase involved in cell wall biosynthesis
MNVLMLCDFYNETLEYQENLLVKYYIKHGHRVTVIASTFDSVFDYYNDRHDSSAPARTYFDQGAKIVKLRYRYNFLNRLRAYTRIGPLLEEEKPDLIYVHDVMLNLPECVAYVKRHPNCRMVMDYHADYSNSGRSWLSLKVLHGVVRKRFLDQARPHIARIFPIVPAGALFLHEVYGVPHSEMEVLPLGADTDLARQLHADGAGGRLRAQMGYAPTDLVVITGGKLAPAKRTDLLLEAVRRVPHLGLKVVVIGEAGATDVEFKARLHKLADGIDVRFTGWLGREDIYRHLVMADLAVFPASQSILWQQAIACGLPLICGDVGHQDISYLNLAENIVILRNGQISVDGIVDALQETAGSRARLRKMREGASRVAEEHLDWNRLINRTLRFLPTFSSTETSI